MYLGWILYRNILESRCRIHQNNLHGVWRDATRRLVHAVGDKEVGGPVSQGVVGAGEGGCRGDLELAGEFFW